MAKVVSDFCRVKMNFFRLLELSFAVSLVHLFSHNIYYNPEKKLILQYAESNIKLNFSIELKINNTVLH